MFSGRFNLKITSDLKALGAKWDSTDKVFRMPADDIPTDLQSVISLSETAFRRKTAAMVHKLDRLVTDSPWEGLSFADIFATAVYRMDREFRVNVKTISIQPEVTDFQAEKIGTDWETNLKRYVKDFTMEQMAELRERIKKTYLSGDRYGSLSKVIKDSFEVSQRKAEFLAQQETNLLTTAYQSSKYVEAGVPFYLWRCVPGTPAHPTRERHKQLSAMSDRGIVFRWDDPPVTTGPNEKARRNNPRQDYRCRCDGIPVQVPPGSRIVSLGDHRYRIQSA